jgi:hypothetical protein
MMNPTLCDLVGGIQTVTLSDEEARRRGTQKSVLERKGPPTFDVVVEIQDWDRVALHHNVAQAVDAILRARFMPAEIRARDEQGEIQVEKGAAPPTASRKASVPGEPSSLEQRPQVLHIFPYGISQNRLRQAARGLNLPITIVRDLGEAQVVMTSKSYYRRRPRVVSDAERAGLPVYVLRSNTVRQMEHCLADIFGLRAASDPFAEAMRETQEAIETVLRGERSSLELSPQNAYTRRRQHEMAREAELLSYSKGKEPRRRVRIHQG